MPCGPRGFRTFRSPTVTCAGASLSSSTWSSPSCSPALRWRPPTSTWNLRITSWCFSTLTTSSRRTSR
uniref:Uncharacterized protein n=1 Tax=Saimiri boliviensis boliviensis TaxID=39432 RepID=A0A2K6UJ26_SAIBB